MRRIPLPVITIGLVLGLTVLYAAGVLTPLREGLRYTLLPAARFMAALGFQVGGSASVDDARTRELESRLASISVDYVKLRELEEENRSLKAVTKFLADSGYDHLGARVIARNVDSKTATVLIDRGAADGLETGMAVIVGDGVLVGKIVAISPRVSTVMLLSDWRSRVAASPVGTQKLFGMVQGEGNGVLRLTLVPQSEPLKTNDVTVTAGSEEKIPANLPIALVDVIEGKATDPFKTATLQPLVRAERLDLVVVLRPAALRPE
jgi:rod shape-determining protein MreC